MDFGTFRIFRFVSFIFGVQPYKCMGPNGLNRLRTSQDFCFLCNFRDAPPLRPTFRSEPRSRETRPRSCPSSHEGGAPSSHQKPVSPAPVRALSSWIRWRGMATDGGARWSRTLKQEAIQSDPRGERVGDSCFVPGTGGNGKRFVANTCALPPHGPHATPSLPDWYRGPAPEFSLQTQRNSERGKKKRPPDTKQVPRTPSVPKTSSRAHRGLRPLAMPLL